MLRAVAARYAPAAASIVAVVPERPATPLFTAAGWVRTELGQYEMAVRHAG
jgi:hypothetical protein